MPTYEEARRIVLESVAPVGVERIETGRALGRTLAESVAAPWPLPFCDNSAMDGYAVRADDCRGPARLSITGYVPAGGTASVGIAPGCAVKIMTGAPIPHDCDAVVPFEETEAADGHVVVKGPVTVRQHIRFRGEDVKEGAVILPEGTPLRPPEISMLASLGKAFVPVYRKVRVAVLSTGDELIELGEAPSPGAIINSNSLAVAAAVREAGAVPVLLGIARDDLESHAEKISEGLTSDALVTTAGVSAGDRDLVRDVLARMGVESRFWKVGIKPGGPTAFGMKDGKPVFSLPGNPVSALITFEAFVRPALLRMMGRKTVVRPLVKATLAETVRKKAGKVNFLRVTIEVRDGEYFASSAGDQNTGILRSMVHADALAVLPADRTSFAAGEKVDVLLLGETLR
ncbi:MAG: molybdopterin molybdenumtransferase MoeA [Deltaproteobacteria bacterium]|nr:MAG: molybdopterin molybdenumtransferase MoeA [Deltaproteobacteria bacterium]